MTDVQKNRRRRISRRTVMVLAGVIVIGVLGFWWTQRPIIDPRFVGTFSVAGARFGDSLAATLPGPWEETGDVFVTLNAAGVGRFRTSEYESNSAINWWVSGDRFCIDHDPGHSLMIEVLWWLRGGRSFVTKIEINEVRDGRIQLRAERGHVITMTRIDQ